ncbi:Complex I intermediate-associated protein 30 (CIA30) [Rhodovulum sp. ES.010]|uniref:CIA30 family protein n=1 Tax=Rhodovulum sp. ES.010 TaxID=1882821 RepID=UPI00092B7143|nr:CIA30 family protein [Rhodovulum sp. ES.010]SIO46488.1 Complex I intermediate-associated protein 30 (CIA30) [Rhodovulum sp. ES.010]
MRRLAAAFALALALPAMAAGAMEPITKKTARDWSFLSDQVMGGVSDGRAAYAEEGETGFLRLTGDVSTENRGGFLQMRRDIDPPEGAEGLVLKVRGNGERYYVHLRTRGLKMPWQFYQAPFETSADWREVRIPFSAFAPKGGFQRATLRPGTVESLGIAAYGRDHVADVSVAGVGFY